MMSLRVLVLYTSPSLGVCALFRKAQTQQLAGKEGEAARNCKVLDGVPGPLQVQLSWSCHLLSPQGMAQLVGALLKHVPSSAGDVWLL